MHVTLRLYYKQDLDLITLAKHPDFEFTKFVKMSLIAYVRGDNSFYISPPERPVDLSSQMSNVEIHFRLCPIKDADIIDFFNNIIKGYRNNVMKIIFRSYIKYPFILPFLYTNPYQNILIRPEKAPDYITKQNNYNNQPSYYQSPVNSFSNEMPRNDLQSRVPNGYEHNSNYNDNGQRMPNHYSSDQHHTDYDNGSLTQSRQFPAHTVNQYPDDCRNIEPPLYQTTEPAAYTQGFNDSPNDNGGKEYKDNHYNEEASDNDNDLFEMFNNMISESGGK